MSQIRQTGGNKSVQLGVVGRDANIDNRKSLGVWGCLSISITIVVVGVTGVGMSFTRETGQTVRQNAPLAATIAVEQATSYASISIPESVPESLPVSTPVSVAALPSDDSEFVSNFYGGVVDLIILSYQEVDPSYAAQVMTGIPLASIQNDIALKLAAGIVYYPVFDNAQSSFVDIRTVSETATKKTIEVDTCEVWSGSLYTLDGFWYADVPVTLIPQTVTIEISETQAWIIDTVSYAPPAFCY
jgi:hypothetical protein